MAFDPLKIFSKKQSRKPSLVQQKGLSHELAKEHLSEEIKPKKTPARDTHGKFVSKPAKKSTKQAKGPYTATFYGVNIRKYYDGGKWYFSIEDILPLGQKDPPLQSLDKLKENEEFNEVFEKVVKIIDNVPCADAQGMIEIVDLTQASFPGPFPRWIDETSSFSV